MEDTLRLRFLRIALVAVGILFIVGIYLLMLLWPEGWSWHTGRSDYPLMIVGIYATLGVFLILAAGDPLAHRSLIWFTVWSSAVHALTMTFQALSNAMNQDHLLGDVPALFIVAVVLGLLTPIGDKPKSLA